MREKFSPSRLDRNYTSSPGVCPDWESDTQPFGARTTLQAPEPPSQGTGHSCSIRHVECPVTNLIVKIQKTYYFFVLMKLPKEKQ